MTAGQDVIIAVDMVNEMAVVGATIAGWGTDVADRMFRTFGPDHFLATEHSTSWGSMREMHKRKLDWDLAMLRQISGGVIGQETCDYLASLAETRDEVPTPKNLDHHVAVMLQDRAKRTTMDGPVTALIEAMKDPLADPDHLHSIARQIPASLKSGERKALLDGDALVRSQLAQIRARRDGPSYPYGLDGLDYYESQDAAKRAGILNPEKIADPDGRVRRMSPGAEPGYITLISAQSGGGKALALDTPIATVGGWTTMGEICVGDEVFDENGEPCTVIHCSPVMRDHVCYRVEFSDGSTIVADAEHLWLTRTAAEPSVGSVRTTGQIAASLGSNHVVDGGRGGSAIRRSILAVEEVESVPVRCIMVDSSSHLYLAGRTMIPTHNTTLASALALQLAIQGRKVLYCAWEPKAGLTLESIACQFAGVSRSRFLQGQATEEETCDLGRVMKRLTKRITFMDKSAFFDFGGGKKKRSNMANLDVFAGYVAESGCDVVIADLWKYVLVNQKPEEEEEALKYQQAMCEDLKFHLFLLQQQAHKRDGQRSDKRPSRDGVKGSGAYLEIVDTFLAPHIPSLWKPGIPPDRFELFVLKQRYGRWPLGIQFDWDPDSGKLSGGTTIPYDNLVEERGGAKGEPWKGRGKSAPVVEEGEMGEDVVFKRPTESDREE